MNGPVQRFSAAEGIVQQCLFDWSAGTDLKLRVRMHFKHFLALAILPILLHAQGPLRHPTKVVVALDGTGDFRSVQEAVLAAPADGSVIRIRPGVYREVVNIERPFIELHGLGATPADVVLSYDLSNGTAGGTGKSASTTVNGDDFHAENLTFENTFSRNTALTQEGSQAVALRVTGDRAVFRRVRFLGYQDTLYANGKGCDTDAGPCRPARQYFADCYIEGNVDFIFGDSLAFFENCEIHALAHKTVMLTAQSKRYDGEQSGYVFDHCRITAEPGVGTVYLGRPWRSHASVVFLNTTMGPEVNEAGWLEWRHDDKPSLPTVFYAEYNSAGPGAKPAGRDSHAHQLTAAEAGRYSVEKVLGGSDHWDPRGTRADMPAPAFGLQLVYNNTEYPELVIPVRDGDAVLMPAGYHPNVSVPGHRICFLWLMAAHREREDRKFGVVNVQPGFAAQGSGLEASRK
jgi:pectinesterase